LTSRFSTVGSPFPYILFISLAALLSGVLNSIGRFTAAAAAPCIPEHLFRQRDDRRDHHGVADWGHIGVDRSLCWDRANGAGLGCCERRRDLR
jgi:hypothetical protein